jgi:hypothetical protein
MGRGEKESRQRKKRETAYCPMIGQRGSMDKGGLGRGRV